MKNIISLGCLAILSLIWMVSCRQSHENEEHDAKKIILLSDKMNKASAVYLTTDERNKPVVSWTEEDSAGRKLFYFAKWDTVSGNFAPATEIPIAQNAAIHEEGMPKIAIKANGVMVAVYEASVPAAGSRWGVTDILYVQSPDGGRSWTRPVSVWPEKDGTTSISFSGICRLGDGEIGIGWLGTAGNDDEEMGRPVQFARSDKAGGFESPVLVDPGACECCRVAVGSGKNGQVIVAYRDLLPGNVRDISVAVSNNGGRSFGIPADFSGDGWVIEGCPHNGPSVATGNGDPVIAWYSGGNRLGVHLAHLKSSGEQTARSDLSGEGRFVQACILPDGRCMAVYNEDHSDGDSIYSRIMLQASGSESEKTRQVSVPGVHAFYPMIQSVDKGHVIVSWKQDGMIYYRKMAAGL